MTRTRIDPLWLEQLSCAVTVCDRNYKILYMNDAEAQSTAKSGGKALIGKNLLDCHSPKSQKTLRKIMSSNKPNIYTAERKGIKMMVYQGQWRKKGHVAGLVEIHFQLPRKVRNVKRD